jgi:hypothetical protein
LRARTAKDPQFDGEHFNAVIDKSCPINAARLKLPQGRLELAKRTQHSIMRGSQCGFRPRKQFQCNSKFRRSHNDATSWTLKFGVSRPRINLHALRTVATANPDVDRPDLHATLRFANTGSCECHREFLANGGHRFTFDKKRPMDGRETMLVDALAERAAELAFDKFNKHRLDCGWDLVHSQGPPSNRRSRIGDNNILRSDTMGAKGIRACLSSGASFTKANVRPGKILGA